MENKIKAVQDITNPTRFADLNYCFLERAALAMTEGFIKYEQELNPEEKNYMKADLKFALGRIGNAIKHLLMYNAHVLAALRDESTERFDSEDHLGHCAANLNILSKYEEMGLLPNTRIKIKNENTHNT
jgi:hypothetical protein